MPSEFALIDVFVSAFRPAPPPEGPGDDAAVLKRPSGALCVTTDSVVEGIHFRRPTFSLEDVGHKALAVNLSDLAAMGAVPRWFLCALALPRRFGAREVSGLARGMSALAAKHRLALAGGNITASAELSVTITAAGEVAPRRALLRSRARPGQLLYVSGTLGDARWGLELLTRSPRSAPARRQKRPTPRVELGRLASRFASAAIDLSDGLAQDLSHLCRASGVGARVELGAVPLSRTLLRALGRRRGAAFAVAGGEDYELLLAVPRRRAAAFERACASNGHLVSRVGRVTLPGKVEFLWPDGGSLAAPPGYDHFLPAGRALSPI